MRQTETFDILTSVPVAAWSKGVSVRPLAFGDYGFESHQSASMSVPVAAWSKAWVCGRSPSEITGSNPTRVHRCSSQWPRGLKAWVCGRSPSEITGSNPTRVHRRRFQWPRGLKAWVCGRSPSEITGSNPTRVHRCLSLVSVVCCQVQVSGTS